MRTFSSGELARMQATQMAAMMHVCQLLRRMETGRDDYGYPLTNYQVVAVSACGFDAAANKEVMDGAQVAVTDARLRLPLSLAETLDNLDRITVTHWFDVEVDEPKTYEIIGEPERGPSGLVLNLRLVTDGSDE